MSPPSAPRERHAPKAVERFIFFSDAVFAFSLTLLAGGLKLPAHAARLSHAELLDALGQMGPALLCYLVTFGVVARLWVRHHRMFERLHDYDTRLITLNFGLLLCVSLEPFTIDLLMESHTDALPLAIYTGVLALTGFASFAVFWHSHRTEGLLAEPPAKGTLVRECTEELGMPFMSGVLFVSSIFLTAQDFAWACLGAAILTFGGKWIVLRVFDRPAAA